MGVVALGRKLKDITRTADLAQQENPKEAFGDLKIATMETLERTDSKTDSAVIK